MERFSKAWDNINSCIVHVRDLPKETRNGKRCDCSCVECKAPLESCQGEVRTTWYFRHQSTTNCKGGPMTALHMLAQELLICDKTIKTQEGEVSYSNGAVEWIINDSNYRADIAGIKPDGSSFIIEIFVSHKLNEDDHKVKYIREREIHSIEIDLSNVDQDISKEDLLNLLLNDTSRQRTIFFPKGETANEELKPNSKKEEPSLLGWIVISLGLLWLFNGGSKRR